MFWGCFIYNKKGPCHIWKPESAKDREIAEEHINEINKELKPILREQ